MIPPDLQRLVAEAEARYLDRTLDTVAASVGVGVRALQSRERTADLALRRAVVAWVLHDRLRWPQARVARALQRTTRQIKKMLRKQRVSSPLRVNQPRQAA